MMHYQWPYALAALLLACGLWLLLPKPGRTRRKLGVGLTVAGLGLLTLLVHFGLLLRFQAGLGEQAPQLYVEWSPGLARGEAWVFDGIFLALAGITVGSAIAAVTLRSPVYCAIWFALTLLGTGGLLLYEGAQFLGVATVVVYAGAILVTFLFVLMLAQPQGDSYYDRLSWEALLSAVAGAVMVGTLTMTMASALDAPGKAIGEQATSPQVAKERRERILGAEHVARLGGQLFSTHLISVEVAGTLLLVALVGAVAMLAGENPPVEGVDPGRNGHTFGAAGRMSQGGVRG